MNVLDLAKAIKAVDSALCRHCEDEMDKGRILTILLQQYSAEHAKKQGELDFIPGVDPPPPGEPEA